MQQDFDQPYQPQRQPQPSYRPEPRRFEPIQEAPAPQQPQAPAAPAKKEKKYPTGLIILLIILAIAGVGLGVWGLIRPDKIETITEYKEVEVTKECEKEESSSEYIYVGEWGIKIKKPTGEFNYSYTSTGNIQISTADNSSVINISGPTSSCPTTTELEDQSQSCLTIENDIHFMITTTEGSSDDLKTHFLDNSNYSKF